MNELVIKDLNGNGLGIWDREMIETIKKTVAKDATDEELFMFAQIATMNGLNPFNKEIWFIKYKKHDEPKIMTSHAGYLKIAKKDPHFSGVQSFPVYTNDTFRVKTQMGEIQDICHEFTQNDRGELVGAWAIAKHEKKDNVFAYMLYAHHFQTKKNSSKPNKVWNKMPDVMICKVAEANVLRRIGGITGLYTQEEMPEEYSLKHLESKETILIENKDPQNSNELIDKHSEMMKKHSLLSDEEIDKNTEKLKQDLEKSKEEAKKKENRKGPVITGSFTKKEDEKTIAEKAIEDSEKPELTVLYITEDFEEISDEQLVETIIERTKSHLTATSGEAETKDIRKLFILHKDELNNLRDSKPNLADECVKTIAGGK